MDRVRAASERALPIRRQRLGPCSLSDRRPRPGWRISSSARATSRRASCSPVVRVQARHLPGELLDSLPQDLVLRGLLLETLPQGFDLLGVPLLLFGVLLPFRPELRGQNSRQALVNCRSNAVIQLLHSLDSFKAGRPPTVHGGCSSEPGGSIDNGMLRIEKTEAALREVGRIERSLFMIDWTTAPDMRRRAQVGLNKGEAHHALKRAINFHQRGELRDRTEQGQPYRVAGLNLLTAIIIYCNTLKLGAAVFASKNAGLETPAAFLAHISPLGWEPAILILENRPQVYWRFEYQRWSNRAGIGEFEDKRTGSTSRNRQFEGCWAGVALSDAPETPFGSLQISKMRIAGWEHINLTGEYRWPGADSPPGRRRLA